MINNLKPYPAYKDSGTPWLDKIPEHWSLQRMKTLLRQRSEKGFPDEPLLAATQTKGVVRKEQYESRTVLALKDLHLLKLVRVGDFVISLRSFQGGIEYAREQGIISPAYTILYPIDGSMHGYLTWLFKSKPFIEALSLYVTGIRQGQNVDYERLSRSPLPLPPADEQASIVRFLDLTDRKIRRYILAKQKLIKLLEEQKQAIIHRAVTRGLDPDVRLKPAGIEWLEEVPENWVVVKIGRVIQLTTGFPFNGEGFSQDPDDVRLLRGINVSPDGIRWDSVVRWPIAEVDQFSAFQLHVGDIVLGMDRPVINSGTRVAMITERDAPSLLLQRVARIRPTEELDKDFALLLLQGRGFSNYLKPIFTGISVPHISPEQIRSFRVALPPVAEQRTIVRLLKEKTVAVNSAISAEQRQILLLRELGTRLIADVVTGKLDVRAAVMTLSTDDLAPELDNLSLELEEAVENGLAADLEEVEV